MNKSTLIKAVFVLILTRSVHLGTCTTVNNNDFAVWMNSYQTLSYIGGGGYSAVFLAVDRKGTYKVIKLNFLDIDNFDEEAYDLMLADETPLRLRRELPILADIQEKANFVTFIDNKNLGINKTNSIDEINMAESNISTGDTINQDIEMIKKSEKLFQDIKPSPRGNVSDMSISVDESISDEDESEYEPDPKELLTENLSPLKKTSSSNSALFSDNYDVNFNQYFTEPKKSNSNPILQGLKKKKTDIASYNLREETGEVEFFKHSNTALKKIWSASSAKKIERQNEMCIANKLVNVEIGSDIELSKQSEESDQSGESEEEGVIMYKNKKVQLSFPQQDIFYYYKFKAYIFYLMESEDNPEYIDDRSDREKYLRLTNNELNHLERLSTISLVPHSMNDSDKSKLNVPKVYECKANAEGYVATVLELGGPSLSLEYIHTSMKNAKFEHQIDFMIKLTSLVDNLHKQNIVHCDLSLDNIVFKLQLGQSDQDSEGLKPKSISQLISDKDSKLFAEKLSVVLELDYHENKYENMISKLKTLELHKEELMLIDFGGVKDITTEDDKLINLTEKMRTCEVNKESYTPLEELNENLETPQQFITKDVFAVGYMLASLYYPSGTVNFHSTYLRECKEKSNYYIFDSTIDRYFEVEKKDITVLSETSISFFTASQALRYILKGLIRPNYDMISKESRIDILKQFTDIYTSLTTDEFSPIINTEPEHILQGIEASASELQNTTDVVQKVADEEELILAKALELPRRINLKTALYALQMVKDFYSSNTSTIESSLNIDDLVNTKNKHVEFMIDILQTLGFKDTMYRNKLLNQFKTGFDEIWNLPIKKKDDLLI